MWRREHLTLGSVLGVVASFALLAALLIVCVTVFPALLVGPDGGVNALSRSDRLKAENDVRLTLLQGLGGLLALGGVAFGAAVTLRQIRVNREANTIGLFTKAIDQLSDEKISVRHGAVYALELLAGLDQSYRGYIHAMLTAFVRQRAPWPPIRPETEVEAERARFHGGAADDVGAALAALARRSMVVEGTSSELENVDLRGAELAGRDLHQVCFVGSNLDGANLSKANLTGATLSHVILGSCDLSGADLTGADIEGTDLAGVVSDGSTKWPTGFRR